MNSQLINENKIITEYSIWMLFSLSGNAVYRLRELELAQFGLTVEQSTILYLISRRGSITLKTIEILTSRQHHSISTLINRMVKMRLVTKTKNTESSKFEILLTAHGKDMYKNVTTRSMEMVFSIFSTKDKERLYTYLNTLLETAQKLLGVIHPFLQYGDADNNGKKNLKEYDKDRHTTGFELWIVFNRTRNSIYRLRELELAQFDLSVEQSAILHFLISQGGSINAKTIEYLTSRQHHSIWALINRMIKMSLVTKTKNPESNKFEILITEHGKEMYKKVPIRSIEMVYSLFSAKEKDRLSVYFSTLLEKSWDLLGLSFASLSLLQQARANSYEDRNVRPPVV